MTDDELKQIQSRLNEPLAMIRGEENYLMAESLLAEVIRLRASGTAIDVSTEYGIAKFVPFVPLREGPLQLSGIIRNSGQSVPFATMTDGEVNAAWNGLEAARAAKAKEMT